MTHELKILPQYYEEVKAGNKNFELRKNDRDYMEHDTVILRAWENGQYLDKEPLKRKIAYILMDCPEYGLQDGFCIIGFRTEQEPKKDRVKTELNGIKTELEQEPCEDAISRKVAIDAFERFIHELGIKDEPYNYGEMALSAQNVPPVTPQEPKTDGDCIYREDAIDAIMRYLGRLNRDFEAYRGTARIILNHLPPVNPQEPKTDTWSIKGVADALERHGLLEQEPCEDCISRAFLIDRILEKVKTRRSTIEICDKLIPLIKDLPSVQPKPKTGHWIEQQTVSLNNHKIMWFECSECGHKETNPSKMYQCEACRARMSMSEANE